MGNLKESPVTILDAVLRFERTALIGVTSRLEGGSGESREIMDGGGFKTSLKSGGISGRASSHDPWSFYTMR